MAEENWMKIKPFVAKYGVPEATIQNALRGEYGSLIGRKGNQQANYNSPWYINVETALRLWKERKI